MHDFVRALVKFRRAHTYAFSPDVYGGGDAFSWSDENGNPPNWSSRHLMMHYTDATQGPPLAILINMEPNAVSFQLPPGNWARVIDTQGFFDADSFFAENPSADPNTSQNATVDNPVPAPGSSYGVPSHSIVVLQQQ
jgi:hypothetical protein